MQTLTEWVKESPVNREGKTLDQMEEDAQRFIRENPVQFICVYCYARFTKLWLCKEHVVGRLRSGNYLSEACEKRCEEDNIDPSTIGRTSRPKRFPWAEVILIDQSWGIKRTKPNGEIYVDYCCDQL